LKERTKSKKIIFIVLIGMIMFCLTLFGFFKIYPDKTDEKLIQEQKKNEEERIIIFEENRDIFDTLVNNLYVREDEIDIDFSNGDIKFFVNEKEEKIGEDEYALYSKIYSLLKCERIDLYKNSDGNKIIEIYIQSIDGHDDFMIYKKDKEADSVYEFSPGWSYETNWYT